MGYREYEQSRATRIRQLARRVEGAADHDLAGLEKPVREALEDGLQLAVDELDVQDDITRERHKVRSRATLAPTAPPPARP